MKKTKFKNTISITIAIMIFVVISTDVMAQRSQRKMQKPGMRKEMMRNGEGREAGHQMNNMLNLSDEQKEQMKTLRLKQMEQMLPIRNQLQEQRAKLQTLRTEKNVDMKAINNLIDDMADLKANQMKDQEAHRQEMRTVLTDEQRILFDSFKGMKKHGRKGNYKANGQGTRGHKAGRGMGR